MIPFTIPRMKILTYLRGQQRGSCAKSRIQPGPACRERSGVSLLIALGLVTVIVLFGLIVSNVVVTSIRQSANVNRANEAYFAAEGGLEVGLLANLEEGAGYTADLGEVPYNGNVVAKVKVQGQVPMNVKYEMPSQYNGMYGVPTPGTGNAGANCDPLKAWRSVHFAYDTQNKEYTENSGGADASDHPCNWNKIGVGDIVSIPLYVANNACSNNPDNICNPADLGITQLIVRVRTPCSNGDEFCSATQRYKLDETFGDPDLKCDSMNGPTDGCGDTIVSWSISGTNIDENKVYELRPLAVPNQAYYDKQNKKRFPMNSEIYEYLINQARSGMPSFMMNCGGPGGLFCVLHHNRGGEDLFLPPNNPDTILNFLLNLGTFARTAGEKLHKPVLKLAVISSLRDEAAQGIPPYTVPYLEYQVISNVSTSYSPTDVSQTITAEGFSGEFKQILEVKQPQEGGLLEYVIQQ